MERIPSKLFRFIALLLHLYVSYRILEIWGFKVRTFLFLTKMNFFLNFAIFSYLGLNSHYKFDKRPEIVEKDDKKGKEKKYFLYTKIEMTMIRVSFSISIAVNLLYWSIMYFKRDFMGDTDTPVFVEAFLHGGNTFFILLECLLNRKSIHNNIDLNSKHVIIFGLLYVTLKYFVYYTIDVQIYPMISKLSVPQYYLFVVVGYIFYAFSSGIFKLLFL